MPKSTDDIQEMFSSFVNSTSKLFYQVGDTLREQAVKSKDLFEEKLKERDLNHEFQVFGKAIFKLVAAGKVTLPESMNDQVEKLRTLIKELSGEETKTDAKSEPTSESSTEE
ncbi:MAG: hypothetical protein CO108_24835 [Deltaproteobacteria bacterium CG_4_9_14_3_um_filter_63_12]|nr:MAG: hypothetical protein CO108_24835 [Deltaproteobacteria bacterium CG_4_9_14_3_um_filter_63_12]